MNISIFKPMVRNRSRNESKKSEHRNLNKESESEKSNTEVGFKKWKVGFGAETGSQKLPANSASWLKGAHFYIKEIIGSLTEAGSGINFVKFH